MNTLILMKLDNYNRQIITEDTACEMLYANINLDLCNLNLDNVDKFNNACKLLYLSNMELKCLEDLCITPEQYHREMSNNWHMPEEYKIDIAEYCLSLCETQEQLQRVGKELLLYQERGLFNLLQFLHYFVSVLRKNNIVWGVGRGSSVASYVLYLLGVHKIDSLYYDLDIEEFLR